MDWSLVQLAVMVGENLLIILVVQACKIHKSQFKSMVHQSMVHQRCHGTHKLACQLANQQCSMAMGPIVPRCHQ